MSGPGPNQSPGLDWIPDDTPEPIRRVWESWRAAAAALGLSDLPIRWTFDHGGGSANGEPLLLMRLIIGGPHTVEGEHWIPVTERHDDPDAIKRHAERMIRASVKCRGFRDSRFGQRLMQAMEAEHGRDP